MHQIEKDNSSVPPSRFAARSKDIRTLVDVVNTIRMREGIDSIPADDLIFARLEAVLKMPMAFLEDAVLELEQRFDLFLSPDDDDDDIDEDEDEDDDDNDEDEDEDDEDNEDNNDDDMEGTMYKFARSHPTPGVEKVKPEVDGPEYKEPTFPAAQTVRYHCCPTHPAQEEAPVDWSLLTPGLIKDLEFKANFDIDE